MKRIVHKLPLAIVLLALLGCRSELPSPAAGGDAAPPKQFKNVRCPAVAGQFYPKSESDLKKLVDGLLAEAKTEPAPAKKSLRALICPHAGYEFSGPIAAVGYKQLVGRNFPTVIVLGPSHHAAFVGAFVSSAEAFQTPLGMVPIAAKVAEIAKIEPFTSSPRCEGDDTPDAHEHSIEVQLPFLQRTLHDFSLVPVEFGQVDPEKVAQQLLPFLDDQTLIVVSTDLSHYHPYEEAKALDAHTVKAICDLRADALTDSDACGYAPVVALIDIAKRQGWNARLLDYRNSGDTSGDKSRVVGYAAIAFFGKASATSAAPAFTAPERRLLLELARRSVTAAATGSSAPKENGAAPEKFRAQRACFVTLTEKGDLRGCIGSIFPQESLYEAVIRRAKSAATEDPRFPPVRAAELKEVNIEISVLTVPKPLAFTSPQDLLAKLRPGVDGVVLRVGWREATYLPQVWEKLPDKRLFMNELAEKAGLSPDAWTTPDAVVLTYQVEAFEEEAGRKR